MKSYQKNWYKKNREQILEKAKIYSRNRRQRYPEKIKLLQLCECCGIPDDNRKLCWDHDHKTGKFRGWICHDCNSSIGFARENKDRLRMMIDYLERNS